MYILVYFKYTQGYKKMTIGNRSSKILYLNTIIHELELLKKTIMIQ